MRLTKVGTPVTSPDGQNAELGNLDGGTDGGSNFLRGLDTETDVTSGITDDNDGLKAGTLTGTGLLLDGFDLQGIPVSNCIAFDCNHIPDSNSQFVAFSTRSQSPHPPKHAQFLQNRRLHVQRKM